MRGVAVVVGLPALASVIVFLVRVLLMCAVLGVIYNYMNISFIFDAEDKYH